MVKSHLAALAVCVFTLQTVSAEAKTTHRHQHGLASFYGSGKRTASGERFDRNGFTAAHRHLAFGTLVRVVNYRNGRSVVVRINDRGPFKRKRIIDLSTAAFGKIARPRAGVASVRLEVGLTVHELSSVSKKLDRVVEYRKAQRSMEYDEALAFEEHEHEEQPVAVAYPPLFPNVPPPLNIFTRFIESLLRPAERCWEWEKVDQRVRTVWQDAARHFNGTVLMTSCYRSAAYNNAIYRRMGRRPTKSMHIRHMAIDGKIAGVSSAVLAKYVRNHPIMRTIGGVGQYAKSPGMIHVDCGPKRDWHWGGAKKKKKKSKKRRYA